MEKNDKINNKILKKKKQIKKKKITRKIPKTMNLKAKTHNKFVRFYKINRKK